MLEVGIGDGSECHRYTYSVVGAEGCAFGFEPFAIHIGLDRIGHEVMLYIAVFLTDHVHMRLKDDTLMVFVSGRSGYTHNDIHSFVHYALDTVRSRKILQPFTNSLLVF